MWIPSVNAFPQSEARLGKKQLEVENIVIKIENYGFFCWWGDDTRWESNTAELPVILSDSKRKMSVKYENL